jgi:hypothetical protein
MNATAIAAAALNPAIAKVRMIGPLLASRPSLPHAVSVAAQQQVGRHCRICYKVVLRCQTEPANFG